MVFICMHFLSSFYELRINSERIFGFMWAPPPASLGKNAKDWSPLFERALTMATEYGPDAPGYAETRDGALFSFGFGLGYETSRFM
jgi:hypothetical protein